MVIVPQAISGKKPIQQKYRNISGFSSIPGPRTHRTPAFGSSGFILSNWTGLAETNPSIDVDLTGDYADGLRITMLPARFTSRGHHSADGRSETGVDLPQSGFVDQPRATGDSAAFSIVGIAFIS